MEYALYGFMGLESIVDVVLFLITYLLISLFIFLLSRKAKIPKYWASFIPIWRFVIFFKVINRSSWNVLWGLFHFLPAILAGFAFSESTLLVIVLVWGFTLFFLYTLWGAEIFKAFGMSGWFMAVVLFVPFGSVLYLYLIFSSSVQYTGIKRSKDLQ